MPSRDEHRCHAIGCNVAVPPRLLMCRRHWFMVPADIRKEVWRCYRPGQEVSKDPTVEYLIAARLAIHAVAVREGKLTRSEADARLASLLERLGETS